MKFQPAKGRATGYSDFYKGSSNTPGTRQNKLTEAMEASSGKPGLDDEDEKKKAIRRRLSKFKKTR